MTVETAADAAAGRPLRPDAPWNPDIDAALAQLAKRRGNYALWGAMYKGKPRITDIYTQADSQAMMKPYIDCFGFPLLHLPVDTVVRDLDVQTVSVPDNDAETKELNDLYEENRIRTVISTAIAYASKFSEGTLHSWPDPETGDVETYAESPFTVQHLYKRGRRYCMVRIYRDPEDHFERVVLAYFDFIEYWVKKGGAWMHDTEATANGEWRVENPYGKVPGVHFMTDPIEPLPEHYFGIAPYLAIAKTWAGAALMAELASNKGYAALYDAEVLAAERGAEKRSGHEKAKDPAAIPVKTGFILKSAAKALVALGGDTPEGLMSFMDKGIQAVARNTVTAMADMDPNTLVSGQSRREARIPYTKKLAARQRLYQPEIEEFLQQLCWSHGVSISARPKITWVDPNPVDIAEKWTNAQDQQKAGVPMERTLREAGYSDDEVSEWEKATEILNEVEGFAKLAELFGSIQNYLQTFPEERDRLQALTSRISGGKIPMPQAA